MIFWKILYKGENQIFILPPKSKTQKEKKMFKKVSEAPLQPYSILYFSAHILFSYTFPTSQAPCK